MGRAPCCDKTNVKRGPWSPEEDSKLKAYIQQHGTGGNWIALPKKIGIVLVIKEFNTNNFFWYTNLFLVKKNIYIHLFRLITIILEASINFFFVVWCSRPQKVWKKLSS